MTYDLRSKINVQGGFPDFSGKSRAQKTNKAQIKQANITGIKKCVLINRWCQLFIIPFILYSFYFLTIRSNFPFRLRLCHQQITPPSPPTQAGIINSKTISLRTADEALASTEPLHQPTRFQVRICRCRHQ